MKRGSRNYPKQINKLLKLVYGLLAAIILTTLLVGAFISCIKNTNDEAKINASEQENTHKHTGDEEEKDLTEENKSLGENEVDAAATAPKVAGKSIDYDKEDVSEAAEGEDKGRAKDQESGSATPWFLISVLTLSTVANGCIAIFILSQTRQSSKLHRERIKLLNDRKFVEPEHLQKTMRDLNENAEALDKQLSELKQNNDRTVQSLAQQTSTAISRFEKDNQQTGEKIQEIMNALSVFKESLDDKDEEIKRYKEGHDSKLISKYILSYIKVRDQIIKMTNSDQLEFKNLEQLADRLSMEIDHAGVKEIEVSVGDKFLDDKYGGKLAAPKLVPTDVPENEGTIASVDLAGYEFTGNEKNMILRLAKVSVYELEQIK
jgi:hypothetical protein